MKMHTIALVGAALLAGTSLAQAQNLNAPAAPNAQGTMAIAPADQTKIQTWIKSQNKASMPAPAGLSLTAGATLPTSVTLYTFSADVGVPMVSTWSYAIVDNKTVLVDPSTRRIVEVLGG